MESKIDIKTKLNAVHEAVRHFDKFQKDSVPLCAAENPLSRFVKIPLSGDFQERYIVGNTYSFTSDDNFIGSENLLPFYELIHAECATLFQAKYADPRPLSGMNCLTTILMVLSRLGDNVAILPTDWGGHQSVKPICERLGLNVYDLPYDIDSYELDYSAANELLNSKDIDFILLAPSDIIRPFAVEKLDLSCRVLLYDISQTMGLVSGGLVENKLDCAEKVVLFGGTHKTLPGPASGLILTNNDNLHEQLEHGVNPLFIRHTQMHHVISLLLALIEMEAFGKDYGTRIIAAANYLGGALELRGFDVASIATSYTETHQLFLNTTYEEMKRIERNAIEYGITLNIKEKALFNYAGIRLGTQEIARYDWPNSTLDTIAEIMQEISKINPSASKIDALRRRLPAKSLKYTFPEEAETDLLSSLHEV